MFGRRSYTDSLIGGIREIQEVLDFCVEHHRGAEIEVIAADQINEAWSSAHRVPGRATSSRQWFRPSQPAGESSVAVRQERAVVWAGHSPPMPLPIRSTPMTSSSTPITALMLVCSQAFSSSSGCRIRSFATA